MDRMQFFRRVSEYAKKDKAHSVDCAAESEGQECCLDKGHVLEFLWQCAVLHARHAVETGDVFGLKEQPFVNEPKLEADKDV